MKNLIFVLVPLTLVFCTNSKKKLRSHKLIIEKELVEKIFIRKSLSGIDSVLLSDKQTDLFISEWNNSNSKGYNKIKSEYWITVKQKNDIIRRFVVNKNLIREKNDWTYIISDSTLFSSFWKEKKSFENPEDYNPISFLEKVSFNGMTDKEKFWIVMTNKFSGDWVKKEHVESLINFLDSKETSMCFLNPFSSYIPSEDYAEKGGYAGLFMKAFKEKQTLDLGLYSCPKVDKELNDELKEWWKKR